jgi:hypothetical protein
MTEDDLLRIERAIERPLPAAVRRFFLNYPTELRTTTRDLGPTPDGEPYLECAADNELCDGPDAIIALNAATAGGFAYPERTSRMLIVGEGGCGEMYWVDLDDERGPVYRFEAGQEPEFSDPVADSLEEFADNLIASYRG